MLEPVLTIESLLIGHEGTPLTEPVDARLLEGTLTVLVGRNGVGKSTLLRTLAGFERPLGGTLAWAPMPPASRFRPSELARKVAVVLTERLQAGRLTVAETVALGRTPYTPFSGRLTDEDKRIVEHSMERAGIARFAHRRLSTLSDGELQRVMLSKALAQTTPVILLDEPTAYLDYVARGEMFRLLAELAHEDGKTLLVSTHDLEAAFCAADQVWHLDGRKLTQGEPAHYKFLLEARS